VRPEGLEPPAYWFEASRSIRLSYGRTWSYPITQARLDGPLANIRHLALVRPERSDSAERQHHRPPNPLTLISFWTVQPVQPK
jgi:hypothetical protein